MPLLEYHQSSCGLLTPDQKGGAWRSQPASSSHFWLRRPWGLITNWPYSEEWVCQAGHSTTEAAQDFHQWKSASLLPHQSQMSRLLRIVQRWLKPEECTAAQVVQRLVMGSYRRALSYVLQLAIGCATQFELVNIAERVMLPPWPLRAALNDAIGEKEQSKHQGGGCWDATLEGCILEPRNSSRSCNEPMLTDSGSGPCCNP